MDELDFERSVREAGGRAYLVGGWVRDSELGLVPHDRDYVVTGVGEGVFREVFPGAIRIGKSFPVYSLRINGEHCDVAFARSERKSGWGYRGFEVSFSPETTIEEDLGRRDTTINAMAVDIESGRLIDPYGGASDARDGVIRAVSERFPDDPVRALRAARQACQLNFRIEPGAVSMMKACRDELRGEPGERLVNELSRALECERPSIFFARLLDAEILDAVFPQIHALAGVPQPTKFHQEGDVFTHSMQVLDRAAALSGRTEVRFAALAHDLGKALTPAEILPRHIGHETRGTEALAEWNRGTTLPERWVKCAALAIREHMRAWELKKPHKIAELLDRVGRSPLGLDGFESVLRADRGGAPEFLNDRGALVEAMRSVKAADAPTGVEGEALGRWLKERRAMAVAAALRDGGSTVHG
ncbi:MAG: HD domain-containing protein [Synergistaceae bacterium]|jgi:tRNA nucleotidyltransferase (CCA-adding enzyme)|nr:HD domain-containing protein [Synergistaceae bacterium]